MNNWNYQISDGDCGLCALSNVFLYKGIDFTYDKAIECLRRRGLELLGYSGFFFYLPLIAVDLGLCSTAYIPDNQKLLSSLFINKELSPLLLERFMEQTYKARNAMYFFYKSLNQMLKEQHKIHICYSTPDFRHEAKSGRVILANVTAEELYQMSGDNTNHVVTLIPRNGRYQIVDPYEKMGYQEFDNWDEFLEISKNHDWSGFQNLAVSF